MANITFIEANGQSTTLNLADGWSLMQGATANGVDGIVCLLYTSDAADE